MPKPPSRGVASSLLVFLLALTSTLSSCKPQPARALDPTLQPTHATQTMAAAQTLAQYTPDLTPQTCSESTGTVIDDAAPSEVLNEPVSIKVYLPPCYQQDAPRAYPVLYMLHGQSSINDQWQRLGLFDAADRLIDDKEIQPFIIVLPSELRSNQDPYQSKFSTVILEDVLPYVEEVYRVCPGRTCRAIGGLSRGGNWAVHIGLANPDQFLAVGAHSTPLFYGEVVNLYRLAALPASGEVYPVLYIDVGNKDEDLNDVITFVATLKELSIPFQYSEFLGYHDENYWRAHVTDYLRWYASQFASAK